MSYPSVLSPEPSSTDISKIVRREQHEEGGEQRDVHAAVKQLAPVVVGLTLSRVGGRFSEARSEQTGPALGDLNFQVACC